MATTETVVAQGERTSQVRIHLSTRSPELEHPDLAGSILVSTGKQRDAVRPCMHAKLEHTIDELERSTCFNSSEQC